MSRTPTRAVAPWLPLAALCLAALCLLSGVAAADEPGAADPVEIPRPAAELRSVAGEELQTYGVDVDQYTGVSAEADWQSRRPWRYGTQNLFSLTLGMEEAGIPLAARIALCPFTLIFDTGNLVFSSIGALYGD